MVSIPIANIKASLGRKTPVTSGLFLVLSINLSISLSMNMLIALAPPAAKVPPKRVEIINHKEGNPSSATIMVGTVVMSNNSTTRSFIKAMKPSNLLFSEGAETVSFPIH